MGPAEAVQAHLDLRAHVSIASHFQVFQLGSDGFYDAVNELASTLKEQNLKPGAFIAPEPGLAQEFTTPLIGAYNAGMPALSSLGSITPTIIRGYDPNTLWEKYQPGETVRSLQLRSRVRFCCTNCLVRTDMLRPVSTDEEKKKMGSGTNTYLHILSF